MIDFNTIELHGHRGARGLWPENSIYSFLKTIELGVDVLEMDIVVTRDQEILVSHDPFFNPLFCLDPNGNTIQNEDDFNIYEMSISEIEKFDCGSKFHIGYPNQEKTPVHKPLLKDVISEVDKKCMELEIHPVKFNIEIKSEERWYGNHQPQNVDDYVNLMLDTLSNLAPERFTLQSFDTNILRSLSVKAPEIRLSYLIEEKILTASTIDSLDFPVYAISPEFVLLKEELIKSYQSKGVKVIPWTINQKEDMIKLAKWGIDGIITDYPDRWKEILDDLYK